MIKQYGTFIIKDSEARWSQDPGVKVDVSPNNSKICELEAMWNPSSSVMNEQYTTAVTGLCIWSKYDAILEFKPVCRSNPGAKRSLSSPKDKEDIIKRLKQGKILECAILSEDPLGTYQDKIIQWQAEVVSRYCIKKLYYSLPIDEYVQSLGTLKEFLSVNFYDELRKVLFKHHALLQERIRNVISAEIDFIRPISENPLMTVEDSYTWPYRSNLPIELGIEEMEEVRIPYQALKLGHNIPPILLGILDLNQNPYYENRKVSKIVIKESNIRCGTINTE